MKVLIACEFSGIVRNEFIKRGHDAMSCDFLNTEKPGKHYRGDVFDIIHNNWDIIIAHPPCTYLSNSGVSWLYKQKGRWQKMKEAALFFKAILNVDCKKIAVENPIPHKYAVKIIGRKYNQIVHPYQFGHLERKATCLWLRGLPKLKETKNVKKAMLELPKNQSQRLHYLSPSPDRAKLRSITYRGIAEAMAMTWG